jgi:ATP-dependent RNA helicase DDX42
MGWFSDSDSEEDEKQKRRKTSLLSWTNYTTTDTTTISETTVAEKETNSTEQIEDDDPLDAFMKGIESNCQQEKKEAPVERLDLENDEDDTAHWYAEPEKNYSTEDVLDSALPRQFDMEGIQKVFWTATDTQDGRNWRLTNKVTCSQPTCDPILDFQSLDSVFPSKSSPSVASIMSSRFLQFTIVQSQSFPTILSGNDALITAQTGQGKTLAYLLPCFAHINTDQQKALVLVPTRELAIQVHQQALPFLKALRLYGKTIIGGSTASTAKYQLQMDLKRTNYSLVVATPGRLLDVAGPKTFDLSKVSYCVLDEADKMLNMGFQVQVEAILQSMPRNRQTVMLSATLGRQVEGVAKQWLSASYIRIAVGTTGETSKHVQQHVMVLPDYKAKQQFMLDMLATFTNIGRTLVFCATREGCEALGRAIENNRPGVPFLVLHGDKHQSDRNAAMKSFTRGEVSLLISTDLGSRGWDVPNISNVINFDPAKDLDTHVHRSGRSGRLQANSQQTGAAYTLLTRKDVQFARVLRRAFVREGRDIDTELDRLAGPETAMPTNNVTHAGLGYHSNNKERSSAAPQQQKNRWDSVKRDNM